MAVTLEEYPANPCQAREPMRVRIGSDVTDPNTVIRARVEVESAPMSGTYVIRAELEAPLVDGVATFFLEHLFREDILSLTPPEDGGSVGTDVNVCKRWRLTYYEWNPAMWELVGEAYHEGSGYADVDIDPLEVDAAFMIIFETNDPDELADVTFKLGMTEDDPGVLYVYPDVVWMYEAVADEAYDTLYMPGFVKASIYKVVSSGAGATSDVRYVVLGGGLQYLSI
jgi:hypothetical protein